jgi:hypothetical protein
LLIRISSVCTPAAIFQSSIRARGSFRPRIAISRHENAAESDVRNTSGRLADSRWKLERNLRCTLSLLSPSYPRLSEIILSRCDDDCLAFYLCHHSTTDRCSLRYLITVAINHKSRLSRDKRRYSRDGEIRILVSSSTSKLNEKRSNSSMSLLNR